MSESDQARAQIGELLIKNGADVNHTTPQGFTALILASAGGREKLLKTLLDKGADVKAADSRGNTALIWAVRRIRKPSVVDMLIKRGANIHHVNKQGKTALQCAKEYLRSATNQIAKD